MSLKCQGKQLVYFACNAKKPQKEYYFRKPVSTKKKVS